MYAHKLPVGILKNLCKIQQLARFFREICMYKKLKVLMSYLKIKTIFCLNLLRTAIDF